MTSSHHPFTSISDFRKQFNEGLQHLLNKQQLGTFILCLANASNDEALFKALKKQLHTQYIDLLNQYQQTLAAGEPIDAVEEDLMVFFKLHTLGFDNIQLTQYRQETPWLCQFNQLRSFRPRRMTNFQYSGEMFTPFVASQFNFNKPFMQKECFWSGEYQGLPVDLFYNKYPFADLHGLLVPQREAGHPQFLLQDIHDTIWQFTSEFAINLPGIALGYNSYGAFASVNHLHFQLFIQPEGLPVSHNQWAHNGGAIDYPVNTHVFTNAKESWQFINQLHHKKQPYNLLYMPDKLFVMQRKVQGDVEAPSWSSGFTWYELSGALLQFNINDYKALTAAEIFSLLQRHSLSCS